MNRPAGIETEYGLNCEGFASAPDFAYQASRLVRAAPAPGAFRGWNYAGEDPHLDMRGTRVDTLAQDPNDFPGATDQSRLLSREELLANTVLQNGARLYNDHNHPEYCTDACLTLHDLVAQDKAGETLLRAAESARNAQLAQGRVRVLKNNTDYHGRSYGCHENYLAARGLPLEHLVDALVPFLVTRIVFAGAGRVGRERGDPAALQLSQRADFFEEVLGLNTTYRRPIFNTRDEPHADRLRFRRLHVIAGDANRSEWATALKVGTTALVLDLADAGWRPTLRLLDPVRAQQAISHDPSLSATVELSHGGRVSALDIQADYRAAAERFSGGDPETAWVLREWGAVLADLRAQPDTAADRVDWVAKRSLLRTFAQELGADWTPAMARRVDLAYHLLDPSVSLHASLVDEGRMRTLVDAGQVAAALSTPPRGTRAVVRGLALQKFGASVSDMEWDRLTFRRNGHDVTLRLDEVTGPRIDRMADVLRTAQSLDDLVAALQAKGGTDHA